VYCSSYSAPRSHAAAVNTSAAKPRTAHQDRKFVALTKSQYFRATLPTGVPVNG
jgi:hypothetical protein